MRKKYYDMTKLMSIDAQYYMPLSARTSGKSYQAKKFALTWAWKQGLKFV